MSVTTWLLKPEEVKAAVELYMVEKQGVSLDDIRSIAFTTTEEPVFGGVRVIFYDPGRRICKSAARD